MKNLHPPSVNKENITTKIIQKTSKSSKGIPLEAIRDNIAASCLVDSKKIGAMIKDYLKYAIDAGIVNEVTGKSVAGFYMVNVSLEKRVFRTGNRKKRVPKVKKQRCKVNKSSFDQRSNRSSNELLYI